ncbi:hypothetical protein D3C76_1767870 [compost metagenome]
MCPRFSSIVDTVCSHEYEDARLFVEWSGSFLRKPLRSPPVDFRPILNPEAARLPGRRTPPDPLMIAAKRAD